MKKFLLLSLCMVFFLACQKESIDVSLESDFDSLQTIESIKDKDGYLMKVNNELTVIISQGDAEDFNPWSCVAFPSHRYVVGNLPASLKGKTDTKIVFSGEVKQFSSSDLALYAGMPLKLTKIKLK